MYVHVLCVYMYAPATVEIENSETISWKSVFFFLTCRFRSISECELWQWVPLSTEPSFQDVYIF